MAVGALESAEVAALTEPNAGDEEAHRPLLGKGRRAHEQAERRRGRKRGDLHHLAISSTITQGRSLTSVLPSAFLFVVPQVGVICHMHDPKRGVSRRAYFTPYLA